VFWLFFDVPQPRTRNQQNKHTNTQTHTPHSVIFVFNLCLPVYPLDGGRILVDSLLACGVAPPTAAKVAIGVALPLATAILVYGAVRVQVTTILIAAFVYWALWVRDWQWSWLFFLCCECFWH
jgi:hypothetical protein